MVYNNHQMSLQLKESLIVFFQLCLLWWDFGEFYIFMIFSESRCSLHGFAEAVVRMMRQYLINKAKFFGAAIIIFSNYAVGTSQWSSQCFAASY